MTPTFNKLPSNVRAGSIDVLQNALATAIDLALLVKQGHWNIKGPSFIAIHQLLDGLNAEMHDAADTMAERLVALGGVAAGSTASVAEARPGTSTDIISGQEPLLGTLIEGYAAFGADLVAWIDETAQSGDPSTSDVLTEVSRMVDKSLWFLEAHTSQATTSPQGASS
ncbi:DNA starvation/stationary phase protection protein Dps [Cognatiyoonia sp. IB215182]|uniref:DNA starvation/stationary phase protection protein Dps n=1 Tax=Cognatiyoonia sp. IB215182 TaxID=3097353 RepID=UPI002A15C7B7|nr:DNA starvation/stationary phase protection protein Dps [Cognatiyoonia sp. IB215182]MDX8355203.1 DNA starvation/stationary phase protection protein Dps [Cognatiyoonia sp. IB215182]